MLVAGHEIRVFEVSPKHVRVSIIGPGAQETREETTAALDLRLRRGQWHGTWDETGTGPDRSTRSRPW